ncbi:pectin lyase fold/virulence factor [Dactylonectria estremocensis]|uniref:Pectin lyase fold/virulence factor n=1 Tax=Dactylonectria estremocensis TaxID=1079267 RepID=A0A9P9IYB4_9HYPO|nr:pectin lyase fold/virulence factor [Dactylonectria estremocensis]
MNTKQTSPVQPADTPAINAVEKVEECHIEAAVEKLIELDINTLSREALTWKSKATFRLALVILVQGLSVAAFAIDGNIVGGMASLPALRDHFDVNTSGSRIAIVLAAMSIGNAVASLFQWLSNVIDRRGTAFLGNCILIVGCVLQAAAPYHDALVVGHLISGPGCSLSATQLSRPQNVVLQVNAEIFDCLHLFTNPITTDVPSSDDPDTVYVAGGAVVSVPSIDIINVTSASIRGHGVLTFPKSGTISVTRSKNVVIDGLIGLNFMARTFESSNVEIRNWRSFSSVQWGDGIDLFCSENVLLDSLFLRNSDDCFAICNHRGSWYGDSNNSTLQNSSLWADVAYPINVATHGNTDDAETVDGFTVRNIDILDHREKQILYQGAIAINPGDSNPVQNVLIEDVRVEDFRIGQLLKFRVMFNKKYNTSPGRGIHNVLIRNLYYDDNRTISNVTLENLTINGQAISGSMRKPKWYLTTDFIPLYANEHVKNLIFIA